MSSKAQKRIKMALYVVLLILAELLQTSVFGGPGLAWQPCVMPVAVALISLYEGAERGCIFGLVGGCIWAWSAEMSMYGAWCIVALTIVGTGAGLITERFLLRGIKTAACISLLALLLTEGLHGIVLSMSGRIPASALLTVFLPDCVFSLAVGLILYPLTAKISRIGGFHG